MYWSPTMAASKARATSLNKDIIKKMERAKAHHEWSQENLPEEKRKPFDNPYRLFTVISKEEYIKMREEKLNKS